jgi:transposase
LRAHDLLVQSLWIRIAKLKNQKYGASSEKIEREIAQIELALEDLMVATAEADNTPSEDDEALEQDPPSEKGETPPEKKPRRRPRVSRNTPRERRELDPGDNCPDCGGDLRVVGEDISELLDMIAAQIKVIEIARVKKSCRRRERMVQQPAPSRPIPRSMAEPSLLASILLSKFDDHVPLYRWDTAWSWITFRAFCSPVNPVWFTAALELDPEGGLTGRGCMMAAVTHVCTIEHVAKMLGEYL